jgi:hypothetical protein
MTDSPFGPPYHKIHTAFKRDTDAKNNPIIEWDWSLPEFAYLKDRPWRWTEKIDGTNTRLYWNGESVVLGGRTDNAQMPAHLTEAIRNLGLLDASKWEKKFLFTDGEKPSVTLYGEGYGPRIQKGGGLYRDNVSFILFDVRVGKWWLTPEDVKDVARYFEIGLVPEIYWIYSPVEAWEAIKSGTFLSYWHKRGVVIEGVVGTPAVPLFTRGGERLVMKLKTRDVPVKAQRND